MSTAMLEYIRDGSQSHPNANRRYTRYKICDGKKKNWNGKENLTATHNMGKGSHKVFKTSVKIFRKVYHL